MKKLTALVLVIMLNLAILGNSFAGYSEPVKEKTYEEIAKEIGVDLQTLEDINFQFEVYNLGMEVDKNLLKKGMLDSVKIYKSLISGEKDLKEIEVNIPKSEEIVKAQELTRLYYSNLGGFLKKGKLIKNSEGKVVGIGIYNYYAQEGIPSIYRYVVFTLSKNEDHLIEKNIKLIDLSENKAFQKLNQNPESYSLFEKIFNRLFTLISTNKGINKKIDDFVNQTLKDQGLN